MELTVKTMVMALCNRKGWISFFPMVSNTKRGSERERKNEGSRACEQSKQDEESGANEQMDECLRLAS